MRHLVRDQADYQRRHEVERVDDEPARIAEHHDGSKYSPKAQGPGRLRTLVNRMKPDRSGGGAGLHADSHRNGGGRRFLGMDGALPAEDAALVDDERTDDDVAEDLAGCQDLEATRGVHVALDRPADHDIAAGDVALDPAVLAD